MKSTLLLTTLLVALLASTATAHPNPTEEPPNDPKATLTYANDQGTVQLSAQGPWHGVWKQCQGLRGDQGVVYAEVLTRYITWNQRQAYHLELYPEWGCQERDLATGKYRAPVRTKTYDRHGEAMRHPDGEAFAPKSFRFVPDARG